MIAIHPRQSTFRTVWSSAKRAIAIVGLTASAAVPPIWAQEATSAPRGFLRPTDNLKVQGVPDVSLDLVDRVRLYTEARGASALDWHPIDRSMLVSTRFGNSNQVHHVAMPGGMRYQLTFYQEPVGTADYLPSDPTQFLFTRDVGGNEFAQIYRFDTKTGNAVLLTDGGRSQNGGWVWDRTKKQICYASTERNGADRDLWIMDPLDPSSRRLAFQLTGGGWSVSDWSSDNQQVLIQETLSVNQSNLYIGDIATGALRPITDPKEQVSYDSPRFTQDGKGIWVGSDKTGEFSELVRIDLASGVTESITKEFAWDVESAQLSEDRSSIALSINRNGISDVYVYDIAEKTMRKVEGLPIGVAGVGPWHPQRREFALTVASARSSSDAYSVEADSLKVVRWTESELGGLSSDSLSIPELIEWKTFDGRTISGFLYLPPRKFEGPRPVIVNIHGGPEGQSRPNFLGRNNYFINELGCAIIFPNVRGSTGYGKSFTKLDNGMNRLDSVRDIGALLDWIAEDKRFDSDRIMVTGGSYGGYMTLACAVEYNDRIACALDVVGISHFGTFLKNTESYRRDLRRVEYGDERIPDMNAFFEKIAPLNNAHRITKPLFVVQGGNDPRVPLSEAEQIVERVQSNGGDVWYLMASDEGHGFRKKNNADFQFYATILFVEKFLLSAP
ncbi:MAG: alpha/beta fold hydrolase [Pirellula sp.]|jgi:dipeptidyl aminopeptidase/acylaminoacyl peptidase|nr:alpha/beta fold hydrolase [Pirellula sp.]